MLSIGPRKSVKVTKTNRTIVVGDNSYLSVSWDGTSPRVILTRGKENGHLLLIECSLAPGFTMVDNVNTHRTHAQDEGRRRDASRVERVAMGAGELFEQSLRPTEARHRFNRESEAPSFAGSSC